MTQTDVTQRTSHTPEPWHYEMEYSVTTIFAPDLFGQDPYAAYIAEIDGQDVGRFATAEQHVANARRIVAAVNACKGIPTEALEQGVVGELLAELDYFYQFALLNDDGEDESFTWHLEKARTAIAKASAPRPCFSTVPESDD